MEDELIRTSKGEWKMNDILTDMYGESQNLLLNNFYNRPTTLKFEHCEYV